MGSKAKSSYNNVIRQTKIQRPKFSASVADLHWLKGKIIKYSENDQKYFYDYEKVAGCKVFRMKNHTMTV